MKETEETLDLSHFNENEKRTLALRSQAANVLKILAKDIIH